MSGAEAWISRAARTAALFRRTPSASDRAEAGSGLACAARLCRLPGEVGARGNRGRLAQLVEHLVYTERVGGSSPSPPTSPRRIALALAAAARRWLRLVAALALAAAGAVAGAGRAGADDVPRRSASTRRRAASKCPRSRRRRRRDRDGNAAGVRRFRPRGGAVAEAAKRDPSQFARRQRRRFDGAGQRVPPRCARRPSSPASPRRADAPGPVAGQCLSACVYALMGASARRAEREPRRAAPHVDRPARGGPTRGAANVGPASPIRRLVAVLARYARRMGVNPALVWRAESLAPGDAPHPEPAGNRAAGGWARADCDGGARWLGRAKSRRVRALTCAALWLIRSTPLRGSSSVG